VTNQSYSEATSNVSNLPLALKKILVKFAQYFDGTLRDFELTPQGQLQLSENNLNSDAKNNAKPLLIVSRNFYVESIKNYPITNKKELHKLLKLETSTLSNEEGNIFYHSWQANHDKNNNQSQVNIWQLNNDVPNAFLRIPESLLLALALPTHTVMQKQANKDVYITRINGLIHSLSESAIINSADTFAMSVGINQKTQKQVVPSAQLAEAFALGIKKLTLPILASFIKAPKKVERLQLVKTISLPFILVFSAYLALTSAYIVYKKNNLQQQLASQSSNVSIALKQQVDSDEKLAQYDSLKIFLSKQTSHSSLWLIMSDLFPTAKFSNIRVNNSRYVLRGSAIKATKVLELLSKHKQVQEAKFDFPTQKNRGRENFVISFKLVRMVKTNG